MPSPEFQFVFRYRGLFFVRFYHLVQNENKTIFKLELHRSNHSDLHPPCAWVTHPSNLAPLFHLNECMQQFQEQQTNELQSLKIKNSQLTEQAGELLRSRDHLAKRSDELESLLVDVRGRLAGYSRQVKTLVTEAVGAEQKKRHQCEREERERKRTKRESTCKKY